MQPLQLFGAFLYENNVLTVFHSVPVGTGHFMVNDTPEWMAVALTLTQKVYVRC